MFFNYFWDLVTAPGVMIHELGHVFFCLTSGVKIYKVKLFQFGRTAGYVVHDEPVKFFQGFLISIGPLIINSFFALFAFAKFKFSTTQWQPWLWLYLGISVGLHAIPSDGDADALLRLANRRVFKNPLVVIGYPFVFILYLLFWLKKFHLDWIFVVVMFWLGNMFLKR